jgi:VWFA-related protein
MKSRISALLAFAIVLFSIPVTFGQKPSTSESQDEQKLRIGTTEVVLDVVVRDKKGRPVRDLAVSDFEVYEDGVRQRIESFQVVMREPGASSGATKPAAKREEPPTTPKATSPKDSSSINLVALVFDRLSPNARSLAHKAALSYASEFARPDDFTGVFVIDQSLRVIQPYTDNAQLVSQAIERVTSLATSTYASSTEQTRSLSGRSGALERQGAASETAAASAGAARDAAAAGAAGSEAGLAGMEQALAQMATRMLETFETLERDQQGYATTNGLLAVINSLRNLPGRKTVIFFSEGLSLPPAVQAHFNSLINAATRANVSVYPVDAAGLRVESGNAEATRELNSLAERRMRQVGRGRDDGSGPLMKSLERNEDLLRLNPHAGLGQLADQTGGFLISQTNDLTAGLRRIDEDMRAHYVLTYVPHNPDYDGRFRQIAVKLSRANLDVQTRKGYYAIGTFTSSPVLGYEAPGLAALSKAPGSNSFAFTVAGLSFPEPNRLGLVPVLAEVPASAFTFTTDQEKKTYSTDFSVVAVVKDQSQQVIKKVSQHYQLSGPVEKLEVARRGEILFYRELELPPGTYAIEAVGYDAPTGKASIRSATVEVPRSEGTNLRLSSIVVLKRAERLGPSDQTVNNPFRYGEVLIYPNTGEPVRKSAQKQLAFFFTAYPAKNSPGPFKLIIEVLQSGRTLGQTSADLPSADASGRVQYASALPLDSFQPGIYELKVTVEDGQGSVARFVRFTVEP